MKPENVVPAGATPVAAYANWNEYCEVLRAEAIARRADVDARRNIVAPG